MLFLGLFSSSRTFHRIVDLVHLEFFGPGRVSRRNFLSLPGVTVGEDAPLIHGK